MATKLATKQVGSFAKDVDVQEFIFESGVKSSTRRPAALKDFYWDYVVIVLVSAILGLTLLDIAAEFFRGTGVRCFSPSTFEGNRQDFTRSQANFVNSFCYQSLPPSEYYSIFILAHGLGLVAPHYLWKVLFGGYFDFFFDLVKGLTRLRSSKTGDYDEMNFEIVRKLQKEYGESVRVFGLYIVKLSLQLGVAVFTLLMGAVYFKDFSPNFTCLDNCSRHYYPREMTNITCVYTSLRFLSIVRVVDMVFVGLTVPFILYGLGWCFIPHTRELGYAKTARFIADSCFLAEHYQPKHVHSVCSSQFRIVSDLNFFLMRLFRTDAGYGQVFREIQIEEEFIRLNKQDSEWLQLHYHSQTNMGDSVSHVSGNLLKPRLEGSSKAYQWKGFRGAPRHDIYRRFSRLGIMDMVAEQGALNPTEVARLAEALVVYWDEAFQLANHLICELDVYLTPNEWKVFTGMKISEVKKKRMLEFLLHKYLDEQHESEQRQYLAKLIGKIFTTNHPISDSVRYGYFSERSDEFKHRLHLMYFLVPEFKGNIYTLDVSFGSTGSAFIIPWFYKHALAVNFDLHMKVQKSSCIRKKVYDGNVKVLRVPADIFVQPSEGVFEFKLALKDILHGYLLDFIVVAPIDTYEKETTVNLLLDKLHCNDNGSSFIHHKAILVTVRPLEIDGRLTAHKFIDYIPSSSFDEVRLMDETDDIYKIFRARIGISYFKKVGKETGIVTFCGGVKTTIKFSLYQYKASGRPKETAPAPPVRHEHTSELPPLQASPDPAQLGSHDSPSESTEQNGTPPSEYPSTSDRSEQNVMPPSGAQCPPTSNPQNVLTFEDMYYLMKDCPAWKFSELPADYKPPSRKSSDSSDSSEVT